MFIILWPVEELAAVDFLQCAQRGVFTDLFLAPQLSSCLICHLSLSFLCFPSFLGLSQHVSLFPVHNSSQCVWPCWAQLSISWLVFILLDFRVSYLPYKFTKSSLNAFPLRQSVLYWLCSMTLLSSGCCGLTDVSLLCLSSFYVSSSHCINQILESVSHIHQHDIVHRDLKVSYPKPVVNIYI